MAVSSSPNMWVNRKHSSEDWQSSWQFWTESWLSREMTSLLKLKSFPVYLMSKQDPPEILIRIFSFATPKQITYALSGITGLPGKFLPGTRSSTKLWSWIRARSMTLLPAIFSAGSQFASKFPVPVN